MTTSLTCCSLLFSLLMPIGGLAQEEPRADYHQHLLSPAVARILGQPKPFLARDLIAEMDMAGIRRAVILSLAYQFGNPNRPPVEDEYRQVKRENDWTADQVKEYPGRLVAFCGVDPLRPYALAEIDRCSHDPSLSAGLKLHFGNSDVDLDNPEHVRRLRQVFRAADSHHMAIVVHLHSNVDHHRPYGAKEAQIFVSEVLSAAPHIPVQVAHLAGSGGYDDPTTDAALSVFLDAFAHHDPRVPICTSTSPGWPASETGRTRSNSLRHEFARPASIESCSGATVPGQALPPFEPRQPFTHWPSPAKSSA